MLNFRWITLEQKNGFQAETFHRSFDLKGSKIEADSLHFCGVPAVHFQVNGITNPLINWGDLEVENDGVVKLPLFFVILNQDIYRQSLIHQACDGTIIL